MSTLGWPEYTADFERYYPTSLLLTGFDIIFFWVARMMMFGLEFTDKVPFKDVYITPLVRDELGKKMTKSKGNVVDPLDLMDQYGADAVRFTLAQLAAQGRDVILSHDRFAASRAFANKIWNAARFVMMNLEGAEQPLPKVEIAKLGLAERWILSRLDTTIREVSGSIDVFEFNVAAMKLYDFIWHEFCDWYIELSKEPLKAGGERQAGARWVLINVFDRMLRLLHPFMPFVSEEIWQVIRPYLDEPNLAPHLPIAKYPEPSSDESAVGGRRTRDESLHRGDRSDQLDCARCSGGNRGNALEHRSSGLGQRGEKKSSRWRPVRDDAREIRRPSITTPLRSDRVVFSQLAWADVGVEAPGGLRLRRREAEARKESGGSRRSTPLNTRRAWIIASSYRKADPADRRGSRRAFDAIEETSNGC